MDILEKVERLREKADVSYEEAKKALDECGGDLLEAIVYLEKQGKVKQPKNTSYTTQYEEPEKIEKAAEETKGGSGIGNALNRFFDWCGRMIQKGNETMFMVEKNDKCIISVPVTVFLIIMIFGFWFLLVVMAIGLFCGCRYYFEGVDEVSINVNKAMDSAADVADEIKKDFTGKKEKDNENGDNNI